MINTSAEYKTAILNNRILHHEVTIEFTDGTTLTPKDIDLYTFKIAENTSNQNSFDIGSVIAKQLNLKISNIDGEYNQHKFSGAKITARVGLEISGRTEWLKKGVYYAEPGSFSGDTISVTAYDSIMKFDTPYSESTLKYPATLGEIVRDACNVCDVAMSADLAIFSQSSLIVQNRPSDSSLTFRQVLQCVGEISCLFFKVDEDDRLTASWYDTDLLESEQLEENAIKIEHYTGTVETDDVVITGVRVTEESSDENTETNYEYGTTGYVLEIKENKLIQTGSGASVAENVGKKINGLIFRPLSIKCQGDPAREAGDIAVVTDRKGNKYKTILTGVTYTAKAQQDLICGAESPAQQSTTRYSKATQVYRELRKTIRQQRTEFVKALESLQNAMDEKEGLHPVTEELEDGSRILYFCDHATLEESKVVIKLNAEGWGMSTDGGETWNIGALVDGTMITKILDTIGLNADWINTGSLSGKYIKAGTIDADKMNITDLYAFGATIGGWDVYSNRLESKDGSIILYSNGRICLGNATLSSISKAFTIKYGLHVYCSDASGFSDGSGVFKVFGLSHVTSGGHLVFASDGATVSYLSSSSKRYKDHVSTMTSEEAEKILNIPVVWFKYKEGYLSDNDWLCGKRIPGFYAEDVYNIFQEAAQLNEEGNPEDWNFRVMIPAMMKIIQDQHKKISNLEEVVSSLDERLYRLEAQMEV